MKIELGALGTAQEKVTQERTAAALGSGLLPVYATPAMVALMERAACDALEPLYENGECSVGVSIHVEHVAATPIGQEVQASARVSEMSARKAVFDITVSCGESVIGTAKHVRVAVMPEKFMEKLT